MDKPTIIIPAAGAGRRMKSYGPKCLLRINGERVLHRQIRLLAEAYGEPKFIVVTGFMSEKVSRSLVGPSKHHDIEVRELADWDSKNVVASIALGLKDNPTDTHNPNQSALIVYGDLLINGGYASGIMSDATSVLTLQDTSMPDGVGVSSDHRSVEHFSYGLPDKWGQVAMLAPKERRLFGAVAAKTNRGRMFAHEVFNEMLEEGCEFTAVAPSGRAVRIDCTKDIDVARRFGR